MNSLPRQPMMDEADLQSRTRQELLALASKAQVRGRHRMSKDQLIATIRSLASPSKPQRRPTASTRLDNRTPGPLDIRSLESITVAPAAGAAPQLRTLSEAERRPELRELTELPSSYGRTRLTLMAIDPYRIYAYWEVTPHDQQATLARFGRERTSVHWVLRFYDVTSMDFDGTNAHSHFDQPIDLSAGNWYVNLWSSEKAYCADIGALAPSGRFELASRSNFVHTPRAEPSPHYRPEWLHVEELDTPSGPLTMTPTVAAPPAPPPDTALPVTENDVRDHYDELVATSGMSDAGDAGQPALAPLAAPPVPLDVQASGDDPRAATTTPPNGHDTSPASSAPPISRETDPMSPAPPIGRETPPLRTGPPDVPEEVRPDSPVLPPRSQARLAETVSSFGSGGWTPIGRTAVDLKLNAELVISGRAQPGQTLQVNGQWLKVNADGTFSVRLALPIRE